MNAPKLFGSDAITKLVVRRNKAVKSLLDSLAHLPRERQFVILTSFFSVSELEKLAAFQKRKT
jgi:hypothetical protein